MSQRPSPIMSKEALFARIDSDLAAYETWRDANGFNRPAQESTEQLEVAIRVRQSVRTPNLAQLAFAGSLSMAPSD